MTNTKQLMHKRRNELLSSGEMSIAQWNALEQVFPGAKPETKVMAWEYCKARKLDPFKRVVHAVPMPVTNSETGKTEWRDVIMPGIAELRTTAHRTGNHAGMSGFTYGPLIKFMGIEVPEYCEVTVYRMVGGPGHGYQKVEFPGRVEFTEACQTTKDKQTGQIRLNRFWNKTPKLMMRKCCEADALRRAFPEELGAEFTVEEMQNAPIDVTLEPVVLATQQAAEQAMNGEDLGKRFAKTDDELAADVFIPAQENDLGAEIAAEINDDLAKKAPRYEKPGDRPKPTPNPPPPKKRGRKPKKEETEAFQKEIEDAEQKQNEFANWAKNSEEKDEEKPF